MAVIKFRNPNGEFQPETNYDAYAEENSWEDEEEFIDEQIENSEKSRKRRREILRLVLRGAGIAVAVGIVIALAAYLSAQRVYSSASSSVILEMSMQDDVYYTSLGKNIVYYSKDGASCLNTRGNMVWSLSFEMQDPIVSRAGEILAICDYTGSTIYLQDDTSSLGSIDTNLPILDLCVSESGEVAAVLSDTEVNWIYLFDSQGNTIAYIRTSMGQSGYPVGISLSPNGELLCVSHLVADSTGIGSSIAFYNFGDVGQNVAENNVSGFNYDDEIFPFIKYMTASSCVAVSDTRIVFFSGKEIPQSSKNILFTENVEGVYADEDHVALLFPDTSGDEDYRLEIYDADGNETGEIYFSMEYTNIQLGGNGVYINNDSDLLIYTTSGQLRYDGSLTSSASCVIPVGDSTGRLFIVTENGIEKMTLR